MFVSYLLACTDLGALWTSYVLVYYSGACAVTIFFACLTIEWRRRQFWWLAIYTPLVILHPAWPQAWADVINHFLRASADCGFGARGESFFLTITLVAVLIALIRQKAGIRSFLVQLTIVSWTIFIVMYFLRWTPVSVLFLEGPFSVYTTDIWTTLECGIGRMPRYMFILAFACLGFQLRDRFQRI